MITNKYELKEYLNADMCSFGRTCRPKLFGDEVYKYVYLLRKLEYFSNRKFLGSSFIKLFYKYRYHSLGIKLGISIPINVFDKGLCIVHPNGIYVSEYCKIGENCRIQTGVVIGATSGQHLAPSIGNNVYIGSGAKLIGDIYVSNNIAIGANSVVVKDLTESDCTYAGVPAKKISNNSSLIHLKGLKDN